MKGFGIKAFAFWVGTLLLAGCGSGSSDGTSGPGITPFAYTGKTDQVVISTLSAAQQKTLANSITRGVGLAIQYQQGDRAEALDWLGAIVSGTGVDKLAPASSKTVLQNPSPCDTPAGEIAYSSRDAQGRYLAIEFDYACVKTGLASLVANGRLIVDSQYHSFAPDQLTILSDTSFEPVTVPVGSFTMMDNPTARPSSLYLCNNGVCKVGLMSLTFNSADGSYSSSSSCMANCEGLNNLVYNPYARLNISVFDPVLGQVSITADKLQPCSPSLGEGLDSPFMSGSVTAPGGMGTTGSLTITYSGCGQPPAVTSGT